MLQFEQKVSSHNTVQLISHAAIIVLTGTCLHDMPPCLKRNILNKGSNYLSTFDVMRPTYMNLSGFLALSFLPVIV